jgi:glycosyltransferase involved in cell wall biosynthesis
VCFQHFEALPVSGSKQWLWKSKLMSSNIGWASEVIDDGVNGYLVHPTQHKAYANRILTLLESPDLRNQFGLSARKSVIEKFSTTTVARIILPNCGD